MIKLGNQVRDTITGFTGIAVVRSEWLYGCVRIGVQSKELQENQPIEVAMFDEGQLEVVKHSKQAAKGATGSFDRPAPTRAREERR